MSQPKESIFVQAIPKLATELGIDPYEALYLFGLIAREIVDQGSKDGCASFEEVAEEALNSFCRGLGGAASSVTVTKVTQEGMH